MAHAHGSLQAVRSKRGHRFVQIPSPNVVNPRFFRLSTEAQNLALRISWYQGDGGIRVDESDWHTDVLRTLEVNGRSRGNATKHLDALHGAGLLQIAGGVAWLALGAAAMQPVDSHSTATEQPLDSHLGLSARNDSLHVAQIRSDQINLRESARAREEQSSGQKVQNETVSAVSPPESEAPDLEELFSVPPREPEPIDDVEHWVRVEFTKRYEKVTRGHPPNARSMGKAMPDLTRFVRTEMKNQKLSAQEVAAKLCDGFFSNPKAVERRWPIAFLAQNPLEYFGTAAVSGMTPGQYAKAKYMQLEREWTAMRDIPNSDPRRKAVFDKMRAAAAESDRLNGRAA